MPIVRFLIGLALALVGLVWFMDWRLRRRVQDEAEALFRIATLADGPVRHDRLHELPAPVQRYLKRSIPEGHDWIHSVRLKQTGFLSTDGGQKWLPFKATQYFTTEPPGFVWWARGWLMPLLWISTRDKYIAGQGNMLVKPASLLPLVDSSGPEMDQGSLSRYLAEAMWFPTALLPGERIQWQPVDAHNAQVTIRESGIEFTMTFTFNDEGDVVQVEGLRYRSAGEGLLTWGGKVLAYREFGGVRIPSEVEVYWHPQSGYEPYFRGTITEIEYNTPQLY